MGEQKEQLPDGETAKAAFDLFQKLFPFVRTELRSLFALVVFLGGIVVCLFGVFAIRPDASVVLIATIVCFTLLSLAVLLFLGYEVACIFFPTRFPRPGSPSGSAATQLSDGERAIMRQLGNLVKGAVPNTNKNYLPDKLQVASVTLIEFFDRLSQ